MKTYTLKKAIAAGAALLTLLSMAGCSAQAAEEKAALQITETVEATVPEETQAGIPEATEPAVPEKEVAESTEPAPGEKTAETPAKDTTPRKSKSSTETIKTEGNEGDASTQKPAQEENSTHSSTEKIPESENSPSVPVETPAPTEPNVKPEQPNGNKTEDQIVETWKAFALEAKQLSMTVGQVYQMGYTYPGSVEEMSWVSENESVLTVDAFGCMTAHAEGTARVVVFTEVYGARYCDITVLPKPLTEEEKDAAAREAAQQIAYIIMNDPTITTDIERIAYAARFVNEFVRAGHTSSFHEDCRTAYGTFVAGYSNCVGSTKATGLVLEYMGYSWYHVNQGLDTHQWCEVYGVDGQTAFCDGSSYGVVGYGSRQADGSNWLYMTNTGELVQYN